MCNVFVVLFCISLATNEVEHFLMYLLALCTSDCDVTLSLNKFYLVFLLLCYRSSRMDNNSLLARLPFLMFC